MDTAEHAVWGISLLNTCDGNSMPDEIAKPAWEYERRSVSGEVEVM